MSFKHMTQVINFSGTRGPDRAIMLALAYRADETGKCWPGLNRIAADSGLTRRTVTRRLPCIEAAGELRIKHHGRAVPTSGGKQAANLYLLTIQPPKGRDTESPPLSSKVGTDSPKGRDTQSYKVGTDSPKGRDRLTPESSLNHQNEPTGNRQPAGLPDDVPSSRKPDRTRIDYEKAEPPEIKDYTDIHNPAHDPVLVAMAITGERDKRAWGHWVKVLNQARRRLDPERHGRAERLFRGCLAELFGEMRAGEVEKPGALLNQKLGVVFQ